jgi:hypothetical protein
LITADFSAESLQARRKWTDMFNLAKDKICQSKIVHPAKLSFRNKEEITCYKQVKLRKLSILYLPYK